MEDSNAPQVVHLNRYYHFTELMRDPEIECDVRRYRSDFDGSMQSLFVMTPTHRKPEKQFFFFHGMDGDSGDTVIVRDIAKRLNATIIGLGGRGPAWLSDGFIADTIQSIRSLSKGASFYLIGVSMGATQALSLAALLPHDLRDLILGVVALIPGSNLEAMAERSTHERVRNTIKSSSSDLKSLSPITLIAEYRPNLPFVVFYNQDDTLLLRDELEVFLDALRRNNHKVATFIAPGNHNFTYSNFDFVKLISRMGSDSTEYGAPLLLDVEGKEV